MTNKQKTFLLDFKFFRKKYLSYLISLEFSHCSYLIEISYQKEIKNLFYVNATLPKAVWLQFHVFPSFDFFLYNLVFALFLVIEYNQTGFFSIYFMSHHNSTHTNKFMLRFRLDVVQKAFIPMQFNVGRRKQFKYKGIF